MYFLDTPSTLIAKARRQSSSSSFVGSPGTSTPAQATAAWSTIRRRREDVAEPFDELFLIELPRLVRVELVEPSVGEAGEFFVGEFLVVVFVTRSEHLIPEVIAGSDSAWTTTATGAAAKLSGLVRAGSRRAGRGQILFAG